jgi:hypothetical protein
MDVCVIDHIEAVENTFSHLGPGINLHLWWSNFRIDRVTHGCLFPANAFYDWMPHNAVNLCCGFGKIGDSMATSPSLTPDQIAQVSGLVAHELPCGYVLS